VAAYPQAAVTFCQHKGIDYLSSCFDRDKWVPSELELICTAIQTVTNWFGDAEFLQQPTNAVAKKNNSGSTVTLCGKVLEMVPLIQANLISTGDKILSCLLHFARTCPETTQPIIKKLYATFKPMRGNQPKQPPKADATWIQHELFFTCEVCETSMNNYQHSAETFEILSDTVYYAGQIILLNSYSHSVLSRVLALIRQIYDKHPDFVTHSEEFVLFFSSLQQAADSMPDEDHVVATFVSEMYSAVNKEEMAEQTDDVKAEKDPK